MTNLWWLWFEQRATSNEQRSMVFCRWVSMIVPIGRFCESLAGRFFKLKVYTKNLNPTQYSCTMYNQYSSMVRSMTCSYAPHHWRPAMTSGKTGGTVSSCAAATSLKLTCTSCYFWNSLWTDGWWLFVMLCYCCYSTLDQAHMCITEGLKVCSLPVFSPRDFSSTYNWIYLKLHLTRFMVSTDKTSSQSTSYSTWIRNH